MPSDGQLADHWDDSIIDDAPIAFRSDLRTLLLRGSDDFDLPSAVMQTAEHLDALDEPTLVEFISCITKDHPAALAHVFKRIDKASLRCTSYPCPTRPELSRLRRIRWLMYQLNRAGRIADPTTPADLVPRLVDAGALLYAAVLDLGGPEADSLIADIAASIRREPGAVPYLNSYGGALLKSSHPRAWPLVEELVSSAGREESILDPIAEDAPELEATQFARVIDLIITKDLLRFSGFGSHIRMSWPAVDGSKDELTKGLSRFRTLLLSPEERAKAVATDDARVMWAALKAELHVNGETAAEVVDGLLGSDRQLARAVAADVADNLPDSSKRAPRLLNHDDPFVAATAVRVIGRWHSGGRDYDPDNLFDALMDLAARAPKKAQSFESPIHSRSVVFSRQRVLDTAFGLSRDRPIELFIPLLADMSPDARKWWIASAQDSESTAVTDALVELVGGKSPAAAIAALAVLARRPISDQHSLAFESHLTTQSSAKRAALFGTLRHLPDERLVASIDRLETGTKAQRDAAAELSGLRRRRRELDSSVGEKLDRPPDHTDSATDGSSRRELLARDAAGAVPGPIPLGGIALDPPDRPTTPTGWRPPFNDDVSGLLSRLDALAAEHRLNIVKGWSGEEELIANVAYISAFRNYETHRIWLAHSGAAPLAEAANHELDDAASTLLIDALVAVEFQRNRLLHSARGSAAAQLGSADLTPILYPAVVHGLLATRLNETADDICAHHLLDHAAALATNLAQGNGTSDWHAVWSTSTAIEKLLGIVTSMLEWRNDLQNPLIVERLYKAAIWNHSARSGDDPRSTLPRGIMVMAANAGVAGEAAILDELTLLGSSASASNQLLRKLTTVRHSRRSDGYPAVFWELAGRIRDQVVEAELVRGDADSPWSRLVRSITAAPGADSFTRLLDALNGEALDRSRWKRYGVTDRRGNLSLLLQISVPAGADTASDLRSLARTAGLSANRLVEAAVFAPQWSTLVEAAVGWNGLADAIWWLHAHSKDEKYELDQLLDSETEGIAARTDVSLLDLREGAVDVDWFRRAHGELSKARWARLMSLAKFTSTGRGHKRTELFVGSLVGDVGESHLVARINESRDRDSLRALALLPVPKAANKRRETLLRRYQLIRSFERESLKANVSRRENEKVAVANALHNMALAAGFKDPIRLAWAIEADEVADLPVTILHEDLTIKLEVSDEGSAELLVDRAGKQLKNVPSAAAKIPAVAALKKRRTALGRQATRIRKSLESAMVNGEEFTTAEINEIAVHPIVAPTMAQLLLVDSNALTFRRLRRSTFVDSHGERVKPSGLIRFAHPHHLKEAGTWPSWQATVFDESRRQPFKQVFRELYVPVDGEDAGHLTSRRYSGHEIRIDQAQALLASKGWFIERRYGTVSRNFVSTGWSASAELGVGPLILGESTTRVDTIAFYPSRPSQFDGHSLSDIPPVVFSEVMRDFDLVVSVAHAGGVDPEASMSTIEMRRALVSETARALGLNNFSFVGNHVIITGELGEYSLHLGSAVVHQSGSGHVFVVATRSQDRGRLFLPFADDDPVSAEVVSKLLMFCRDAEIRDPAIRHQIDASPPG